jgi:hypothetical protein
MDGYVRKAEETARKNINKSHEFLGEPVVTINDQKLNGYQVMELIQEQGGRRRKQGKILTGGLGTVLGSVVGGLFATILSIGSGGTLVITLGLGLGLAAGAGIGTNLSRWDRRIAIGNLASLAFNREEATSQLKAFFQRLSELDLMQSERIGSDERDFYGFRDTEVFWLTPAGLEALQEWQTGGRTAVSPLSSSTTLLTQSPKRLMQLKALISDPSNTGVTGYRLLETLSQLTRGWGRPGNWLRQGISQTRLGIQAGILQSEALETQLAQLEQVKLVERVSNTHRVRLTAEGKALLAEGEPMKSGQISDADLEQMIQLDIDRLNAEKIAATQQIQAMATQFAAIQKELETVQQQAATTRQEKADLNSVALSSEQDPLTREGQRQAVEFKLQRLTSQEQIYQHWIRQFEASQAALRPLHQQWEHRIELALSELITCQTKLRLQQSHQAVQSMLARMQQGGQAGADAGRLGLLSETQSVLNRIQRADLTLEAMMADLQAALATQAAIHQAIESPRSASALEVLLSQQQTDSTQKTGGAS